MKDPHVVSLHYWIGSASDDTSYKEPEVLLFDAPVGTFKTSDNELTVELHAHFSSGEEARCDDARVAAHPHSATATR